TARGSRRTSTGQADAPCLGAGMASQRCRNEGTEVHQASAPLPGVGAPACRLGSEEYSAQTAVSMLAVGAAAARLSYNTRHRKTRGGVCARNLELGDIAGRPRLALRAGRRSAAAPLACPAWAPASLSPRDVVGGGGFGCVLRAWEGDLPFGGRSPADASE